MTRDLFCPHGQPSDKCAACRRMYQSNGRSFAHPGRSPKLWRGWRDSQPTRAPVTVKQLPDAVGTVRVSPR